MTTAAYVSVQCMGTRSPVAINRGSCSAIVRHDRLSAPSPSIVAKNPPAKNLLTKSPSAPHAYSAPVTCTQIAVPPFLH
jgi:hypothetical protein